MGTPRAWAWIVAGILAIVPLGGQSSLTDRLEKAKSQIANGRGSDARPVIVELLETSLCLFGAHALELNDYEMAAGAFDEALELRPDSLPAVRGRAIVLMHNGQTTEAIELVRQLDPATPDTAELLGKLHYLQGDFTAASAELRHAASSSPGDLGVAYTLALALLRADRGAEAEEVFSGLLHRRGESPELRILIGRAYRETADLTPGASELYLDRAVAEFEKAIELNPLAPRAHYYLALTQLKREGMTGGKAAVEELEAELQVNPDHFYSHYFLGLLHLQNREYDVALGYLRKAQELNPGNPDIYLLMGRALYWSGQYEDAVDVLTRLTEVFPSSPRSAYHESNVHYLLGRAILKLGGSAEDAEAHLAQARELKRQWSLAEAETPREMKTGALASDLGTIQVDESVSRTVLIDSPPTAERKAVLEPRVGELRLEISQLYLLLAQAWATESRFDSTAQFIARAATWDDSPSDIYYNLGVAYSKAGQPQDAAPALIKDLARNPTGQSSEQLLANVTLNLVGQGLNEPALPAVSLLIARHPEVSDLYVLRARVLSGLERDSEAAESLEKATQLRPDFADAYLLLVQLYTKLGRTVDARNALAQYRLLTTSGKKQP